MIDHAETFKVENLTLRKRPEGGGLQVLGDDGLWRDMGAAPASGITQEMAITALVNLHHSIRGEDCPREVAVGCATSAVMQLKRERDELRELLRGGFAYVRDANQLMVADGDLDEEDEDGANEWLEKAAAALVSRT